MNKIVFCLCIGFFLCLNACSTHNSDETQQAADLPELSCVAVLPVSIPVSSSTTMTKSRVVGLEQGAVFLGRRAFARS